MRRYLAPLFLVAALTPVVAPVPARAQTPAALDAAVVDSLERLVTTTMTRRGLPGMSVAVASDGEVRFEGAWGLADVEHGVAAHPATVYPIASITKSFTAVAAFQLAEEGRLDMAAPIQRYVSSFPHSVPPLAVDHLLRHTSGIRHYETDSDADPEYANTRRYESPTDAVRGFADDSLLHAPGAGITYSSFAYTLLGAAIEAAADTSFMAWLEARIFEPAGLRHTMELDPRVIVPRRARGYLRTEDGELRNAAWVDPSNRLPGGGLISTAGDMARFAIALMDGRLLSAESFAAMTDSLRMAGASHPLGAGWAIGTGNWLPERDAIAGVLWSGGNIHGATSMLYLIPARRMAIAIATNLQDQGTPLLTLADGIARLLVDEE